MAAIARTLLTAVGLAAGLLLLAPVALIAAPFFAAARLTRLLGRLHHQPAAVPWRELSQYEPEIGWRPRENLDTYGEADESFHMTTGPDGWRGQLRMDEADVVVFGDSFAFGHGADDRSLYTQFCRGLRVKPIASDGYNMVHSLLWMRRLTAELRGKLVVWFVYSGNDLHENLYPSLGRYRMPFARQQPGSSEWEIVTGHVNQEPWPFRSTSSYHEALAELSCPTPTSRRIFDACDFLIREAHAVCAAAGAQLVVVSIPMRVQLTRRGQRQLLALAPQPNAFDVDRPDKMLQESCHRLGVPFVSLKPHLRPVDYLSRDIHWTPSGHRRVGRLLADLHRQHRPAEAVAVP